MYILTCSIRQGTMYSKWDTRQRIWLNCWRPVRCITPQSLVKFHTEDEVDAVDNYDMQLLCTQFGIVLLDVYRRFVRGGV